MPAMHAVKIKARPDALYARALFVSFVLVVWILVISARLIHLQTVEYDMMREKARAQQQDALETSPVRGLVLDRQGRNLARSVETESFFAVPSEVEDATAILKLAQIIGADEKRLGARLEEARTANRKFLWIARKLNEDQAAKIHALSLHGIYSLKEPKRYYPNEQLAAHVLGFVGLDENGLAGIEQVYNERIAGDAGKVFVERDAIHRPYNGFEIQAKPGQSVTLTIDQTIQYRTEQALTETVERTRAKSGTAIVLDPHTGEILALANAPTFNPNDARTATAQARVNQALQNIYEPGSTFKIVAYSAAIEKGLAKPSDRIDCQMGAITVAGRVIHDHHPFGTLTLTEALAKSSNVAAIKLGLRVGDEAMYEYLTGYGFGARTGVELPGETAGLVRPVARWQPSSIGSIAMGQEIGVTPLQMAAAFGAIANDGVRVAPHLVREIRAADGAITYRPQNEAHRVISAETAKALRGMLEGVTLNGTAKLAQLEGYTAAGKTGTAQKIDPQTRKYSKTKYIGSFVGFAPVENPAVVIIVVIDEPTGAYHGGDVAAPVFREIAEQILPELNVAPDTEVKPTPELIARQKPATADEYARAQEELQREAVAQAATLPKVSSHRSSGEQTDDGEIVYAMASKRAVLMPDLRGQSVRDAARICAQLGLQLEAHGQGRALRQQPAPGAEVSTGQTARIDFGRSD